MAIGSAEPVKTDIRVDVDDLVHTGPSTIAGRFLRTFWMPAYRSEDVPVGRAKPLRIMDEDLTLYRGESGSIHAVAFRCAHRGTQLNTGWVEGENIRCFYHGWVYDGAGRCVEQPAEPTPFCDRVRIRSYPVEDYLGVVFVYMGQGDPPPMQRFRNAEAATLRVVETAVYPFNFWNSLDNKRDYAHNAFVHQRGGRRSGQGTRGAWKGFDVAALPAVDFEETEWGYSSRQQYPSGLTQIEHILMPVGYLHKSRAGNPRPEDPPQGWRDTIRWTVPIDDEHHRDISVYLGDATDDEAREYLARRQEVLSQLEQIPEDELVQAVLDGRMTIEELAEYRIPGGKAQDSVARLGQGVIANRREERLGYSDRSLILYRKLWLREMRALAEGQPLKEWRCPEELLANWEVEGEDFRPAESSLQV